jgi:hypothetical protein
LERRHWTQAFCGFTVVLRALPLDSACPSSVPFESDGEMLLYIACLAIGGGGGISDSAGQT